MVESFCNTQKRGWLGPSSLDPDTSPVCCKNLLVTLPHDAPERGSGFLRDRRPCSLLLPGELTAFWFESKGTQCEGSAQGFEGIFPQRRFFPCLKRASWDTASSPLAGFGVNGDDDQRR